MRDKFINFQKPQRMFAPGFEENLKKINQFYFYPPNNISSQRWYKKFEKKINKQMNKKAFFPIFRMSDGEFIFLLNRRFDHLTGWKKFLAILQHLKRTLYYKSTFYSSGRPGYCESYSIFHLKYLKKSFLVYLKKISEIGMICPNFSSHWLTSFYQKDILNLFKKNKIFLHKENYFGYYFVSIFFLGKKIKKNFLNKKILFFTSYMPSRNRNLKKNLIKFGAKSVEFYITSLNQPMLDKVDLKKIKIKPDLVFVAAGVGSSNILLQLQQLQCLCVDCGFMVDALSDINLAKKRIFHLNDHYAKKKKWFD
jgi:hypothetical protein